MATSAEHNHFAIDFPVWLGGDWQHGAGVGAPDASIIDALMMSDGKSPAVDVASDGASDAAGTDGVTGSGDAGTGGRAGTGGAVGSGDAGTGGVGTGGVASTGGSMGSGGAGTGGRACAGGSVSSGGAGTGGVASSGGAAGGSGTAPTQGGWGCHTGGHDPHPGTAASLVLALLIGVGGRLRRRNSRAP